MSVFYILFLLIVSFPLYAQTPSNNETSTSKIDITHAIAPALDDSDIEVLQTFMDISYVYTANRRGLATTNYPFPTLWQLDRLKDVDVKIPDGQSHALSQNNYIVFHAQNNLKSLLELFNNTNITCTSKDPQLGLTTFAEDILFEKDIPLQLKQQFKLSYASHEQFLHSTCKNELGTEVEVIHLDPIRGIKWNLDEFEFHTYINVVLHQGDEDYTLKIFGRPVQDISRSVAVINDLKKNGYFYFDAGSFVNGASKLPSQTVSLHRAWQFELLENLEPVVLGIGTTELINGFTEFQKEIEGKKLPYIATNIVIDEKTDVFPQYLLQDIETKQGKLRVGFISITDPKILQDIPILEQDKFVVLDPIKSTQEVVDSLNHSKNPPDLIVALGNISTELLGDIRRYIHGVDIIVGDPSLATLRIKDRSVQFLEYDKNRKGAPLTLPTDGLSEMTLIVAPESNSLQRLRNIPIHVYTDMPITPSITKQITEIQSSYYPKLQEHFVLPPREGIKQKFTQEEWEQFICESIRFGTNADAVLLRRFTSAPVLPGPLSKQQLLNSLNMMDVIEEYHIQGMHLQRILPLLKGEIPIACGAKPTDAVPKPRGVAIDPQKMYRIVTTDQTRLSTSIKWLLPSTQNAKFIDQKLEKRKLKYKNILAKDLIYDTINKQLQHENIDTIATYLMETQYKEISPNWTFRIDSLSLTANDFIGMENEAFGEIPESLAQTNTSQTLGYMSQLKLIRTSPFLQHTFQYTSKFSELTTEGENSEPITSEVNDDWLTTYNMTAINRQLPIGPTKWNPYGELSLDSEFTPTEEDDGTINPQQADLSLAFGMAISPYKSLKVVKISFFANQDISPYFYEKSDYDIKPLEYGPRLEFNHQMPLFKHFIWIVNGDLKYFSDTTNDDASDLKYRLYGISKLSLPFSRYASVTLYGEGLAIKGRIPETSMFGFAWNTGISLDLIGSFDL